MTPREELTALRRLAELEAKAKGAPSSAPSEPLPDDGGIYSSLIKSPAGGFVKGMMDIPDAGAQLLRRAVPESVASKIDDFNNYLADAGLPLTKTEGTEGIDRMVRQNERFYQQERRTKDDDPGFDWQRLGGNIVAAAPLMKVMPSAAKGKLLSRMFQGGMAGASIGALSPVTEGDFAEEKLKQTGLGFGFGSLAPAVLGGVSRMVKPNTSKQVQSLMKEGVTPTPGQILGGVSKRAEEALTSVPVTGDIIRSAQRRSVEELNRAAMNRVLKPIGKTLEKGEAVGRDTVKKVGVIVSQAYDDLLPKLNITADKTFSSDVSNLRRLAEGMPRAQAKQFEGILRNDVIGKFTSSGKMMGETMKEVESKLGGLIRNYGRSENPDHRLLADALKELQSSMRSMVERANPKYAGQLKKINEAYANLLRVENASGRVGSAEGVFSPEALRGGVRAMDKSLRKRAFTRGDALMQDLAESGVGVLGKTVPDSGTPFRALMSSGPLGLLSTAATLPAAIPYTKLGQSALAGILTKRPAIAGPVSDEIRRLSLAAALSAPAAYSAGSR